MVRLKHLYIVLSVLCLMPRVHAMPGADSSSAWAVTGMTTASYNISSPGDQTPDDIDTFWARYKQIIWIGLAAAVGLFFFLRANRARHQKIEQALRDSTERLSNLRKIEKAIIAAQSLTETTEVALRQLRQFVPWTGAGISLVDRDVIEVVTFLTETGELTGVPVGTRFAADPEHTIPIAALLNRGENCLIEDIMSVSNIIHSYADKLAAANMRSILIIPMISQDELVGLLSLAAPTPDMFQAERIEICREVADQLAIAIKETKLLEAEKAQREMAEALRNSIALLTGTLDLGEVLDRILDNLGRVVPHDAANIMLVEGGVARIVGRRGYFERGLDETILAIRYSVDDTPNLREMIDTGSILIIPDAREYPGWVESLPNRWIRGYIGAPIQLENRVIGFLNLDNSTPGCYNQGHAERLQVFADQAAVAIRNAQLYEAEQKRRRIAETLQQAATALNATLELDEVLDLFLRQLRTVIDYDTATFQRIENGHLLVLSCAGFKRPGKVIGLRFPMDDKYPNKRVVELKKPLALVDAAQEYPHFKNESSLFESGHIRSWLGVPLLVKERLIGMITLDRTTVRPYTQEDVDLVSAFASQAAVAIENASLHQITLERAARLELVGQVGRQASSILALDDLLQQAVRLINDTFGYFYTNILLAEGDELVLSVATLPEMQPLIRRIRLKIGEQGITGWVAHHGEPLLVDDVRRDSRYILSTPAEAVTRSELAVPIKLRDQVIGVLNVESEEVGAFTQADVSTLQTIADQLAVAIHNARLYEQITSHAEELEQRVAERTAELEAANKHLKSLDHLKDEFVSNVSHELRTPITSLKLRIHLLEKHTDKPEHLEVMRRETERLQRIVEELLELSRLDQKKNTLNLKSVDLNALVSVYVADRFPIAKERQ